MEKLTKAIELRKQNKADDAFKILAELILSHPQDAQVQYQMAWTFDSVGKESEAVPFYEKAITLGLPDEDLRGALLGLGSTYRCLGEYENSLRIFDQAVEKFPEDRSLKVFRALTMFNLGRAEGSVQELLVQLLDTTNDQSIKSYEKALRFYSDKLTQT